MRARTSASQACGSTSFNFAVPIRLHQLAVSEGVSLQEIIVRGLTEVFTSKGLPGIGG